MSKAPIRTAQLVTPFGPGALYTNTDGHVLLVAGLDQWFKRRRDGELEALTPEEMAEFVIQEPRLSKLLGDVLFRRAPDYRRPVRNQQVAPNAELRVPAVRFPTWYRRQSGKDAGQLRQTTYHQENEVRQWDGRWVPVRFAAACEHGHLNEFPWKEWAQCACETNDGLRLEDLGGTGLESIRVFCETCPAGSLGQKRRTLQGLTLLPEEENESTDLGKADILCGGSRPWLGKSSESCGSKRLVAVLLNQSNLYQAQTASSLKLPDPDDILDDVQTVLGFLRNHAQWALRERVTQRWQTGKRDTACDLVGVALEATNTAIKNADASIAAAVEILCGEHKAVLSGSKPQVPDSENVGFRREEFELLRKETPQRKPDLPLRVVAAEVPKSLARHISHITRVEKLTEVRVMCGFSRLREQTLLLGEVSQRVRQQLYRAPPARGEDVWLPAMQVSGEGIFIHLSEDGFDRWYERNVNWLGGRLNARLVECMAQQQRLLPPQVAADNRWAARFMLVHTFSHILINQLVFESGYSSAALRERLYVSPDTAAPMMATLIYTAQGDSEGTLGGLVNLGHPDRFEPIVMRALAKASWCSADPICSESGPSGAKRVNLAACHACSLLPETACETMNDGLDRGVAVGTPEDRERGYFSDLLGI